MYSENGLPSVTPWRGNSTHRAQAHVQSWAPAGGPGLCVQPFQWPRQARGLKPKALGPVCGCGTTRCSSAQVSHTRINRSPARWAARPGPGHQGPAMPGLATRGGATTSEAGRDRGWAGRCCCQARRSRCPPRVPTAEGGTKGAATPHSLGLQDDVLVQGFLPVGQAALQHVLVLLRQLLFHVPLGSPQDKGLRHLGEHGGCCVSVAPRAQAARPAPAPAATRTLCRRMTTLW